MQTDQTVNDKAKQDDPVLVMLAAIPGLAEDAIIARDVPWRGDIVPTRRTGSSATGAPTSLAWLAAMDKRTGCLAKLSTLCATIRSAEPEQTPGLRERESWWSVCGWLMATAKIWRDHPRVAATAERTIRSVHATLSGLVGQSEAFTPRCPTHNRPIRNEGGLLRCPFGCVIDVDELAGELLASQTLVPTSVVEASTGYTRRQLRRWTNAGYLAPRGRDGGQRLWNLDEVRMTGREHASDTPGRPTRKPLAKHAEVCL